MEDCVNYKLGNYGALGVLQVRKILNQKIYEIAFRCSHQKNQLKLVNMFLKNCLSHIMMNF